MSNQNLKGTIFTNAQGVKQDVDYIIITPSLLGTQAEKLANFHRNYSKLNVKVVFLENIYQEKARATLDTLLNLKIDCPENSIQTLYLFIML